MNDKTGNVTVCLAWGGRHGKVLCDYLAEILSEPGGCDPLSVLIVKFKRCRTLDVNSVEYTKACDIPEGLRNEVEGLIGTTVEMYASAIKNEIPTYIEAPIKDRST